MTAAHWRHTSEPADLQEAARRSLLYGVDPLGHQLLSPGDMGEAAERLADLSDPIFRPILDQIADADIGVILADHRGNIALREAASTQVRAAMDDHALAVGYSLAEDRVGTNGVGTSLATKRPAVVIGSDHHLDAFKHFSCVHAPVVHPISHRITGAVGLVCPVDETTPLLLPTAMQLAQAIEDRLLSDASPDDRLLLDGFIRHRRSHNIALLAVNANTWIATPSARAVLADYDHDTVWSHVERSLNTNRPVQIGGRNGRIVELRMRELLGHNAAIFTAAETTTTHPPQRLADTPLPLELAGMAGHSAAWQHVVRQAHSAARASGPMRICGEFGTGRSTIAVAIARRSKRAHVVLDAGTVALDGPQHWLEEVRDALEADQVVIVRDADLLDDTLLAALTSIARRPNVGRLIITLASGDSVADAEGRLRSIVPTSIVVPPLRARPEDIEPIARQHLAVAGRTSVSPRLYGALRRRPWTGNVAGLLATLDSAMAAARHDALDARHLPAASTRAATAGSGSIQHAEESAIRRALSESDGNRRAAAELLGISRATLYRRLRTYGID